MSQSIPEETVLPVQPRLSREDRLTPPWHVGQPCGKYSWENLVGNLEGNHRSLDPRDGKRDTDAAARRKAHENAHSRNVD